MLPCVSDFKLLVKDEAALKKLSDEGLKSKEADAIYWAKYEKFRADLRFYIRERNFTELPKASILKLIAMVSSYRPMELHTFFIHTVAWMECEK